MNLKLVINMSNRLSIGIDIDGVLRDFIGKTIEKAAEHGLQINRPTEYNYIDKHFIDGKSLRHYIWGSEGWLVDIFENSKVLPFAQKGYEKFCNDDQFDVHIVTAQEKGTEHYTRNWLDDNGFDKHDDTYYEKEKLKAPCQILIDDATHNIKDYQENLREGYLVTCSYNLDSKLKPRVKDLNEAYEKIKKEFN